MVEDAPERGHDGEEEGVAGRGEARAVQEGHQEAKADEDHHVHVLEVGVAQDVGLELGRVVGEEAEEEDHHAREGEVDGGRGVVHRVLLLY